MNAVVEAPLDLVEAVASLRIPPRMDRRMQELMDHNTDGSLGPEARAELEALVELSENIALLRARALKLLGQEADMISRAETLRLVEAGAGGRCEYCRMHQALQGATFHLEHIVPGSRGGPSEPDNLAWACPTCNLHKSDRLNALDPESNALVPLFNPCGQRWDEHFRWDAYRVVGRTPVGRGTIHLLDLNHPRRQLIRQAEESFGLFPP